MLMRVVALALRRRPEGLVSAASDDGAASGVDAGERSFG
jgi:hypothetical protein